MADAITIKALQDASLDAKSLEEVVNGDEVKQVTTRKGETYPSVKKAIKTMFENGGLPATPFKTKTEMESSELVDGDYAIVTDDESLDNNGLYIKQSGVWLRSKYDATTYADKRDDDVKDYLINVMAKNKQQSDIEAANIAGNIEAEKHLDSLIESGFDGFAFDASIESSHQVVTVKNGVKRYEDLNTFFNGATVSPKVVVNKDGSFEWSKHNFITKTKTWSGSTWLLSGLSVSEDAKSINGDNSAILTTTTSTASPRFRHNLDSFIRDMYATFSFIIKPIEGVTHAYIGLNFGNTPTFFNLSSESVDEIGEAHNASVVSIGNGYFKVTASFFTPLSGYVFFGISDRVDAKPSKVGLKAIMEQPQAFAGLKDMPYLDNNSDTPRVDVAIDYSDGDASVLLEKNKNYFAIYSDDLTNPVWVKTSASVDLLAESPLGTPCSRVEALSNNATVTQDVTRTLYAASVLLKRESGSGKVYITMDNAETWKDITSSLGSEYRRVSIEGTGRGVGIKLENSGDVVSVCMFNAFFDYALSSPKPVYSKNSTSTADNTTPYLLNSGDVTSYIEVSNIVRPSERGRLIPVLAKGEGSSYFRAPSMAGDNVTASTNDTAIDTAKYSNIAQAKTFGTLCVTSRIDSSTGLAEVGINGEYTLPMSNRMPVPAVNTFEILPDNAGAVRLKKLVVVDGVTGGYDLTNWRFDSDKEKDGLVNSLTVVKDSEFDLTEKNRIPALFVLSDDGDNVDMLVMFHNKFTDGHHAEAPFRLMQRKIRYVKSANKFHYTTPSEVMYEHDGWKLGKGHSQAPVVARIKSGANKGRLVALFTRADSDEFANRNTYRMFNDSNGDADAWTTPVKVIDSQEAFSTSTTVISPDGTMLALPTSHPTAPNRLFTCIGINPVIGGVYSDDGGETWQHTQMYGDSQGRAMYEPTSCLLPNGDILITTRTNSTSERYQFISKDGGETFEQIPDMTGFEAATVPATLVQLDPTGAKSENGDIVLVCGGSDEGGISARLGLGIRYMGNSLTNINNTKYPINRARYVGYTSSRAILSNEYIATAIEGGSMVDGFNGDNSVFIIITKV